MHYCAQSKKQTKNSLNAQIAQTLPGHDEIK